MVSTSTSKAVDSSSTPSRVKSMTLNLVFTASLLTLSTKGKGGEQVG